jgi:peptidoglycan/LPS O-acetylase OafA/YrhL
MLYAGAATAASLAASSAAAQLLTAFWGRIHTAAVFTAFFICLVLIAGLSYPLVDRFIRRAGESVEASTDAHRSYRR